MNIQLFFILCLLTLIYIYFGYPLVIFLLGVKYNRAVSKGSFFPTVTIVISAYNEEKNIHATLLNKLNLDYPQDKLEVIVVSDGSDDKTDEIVKQFDDPRVNLLRQEPRAGKTAALNMTAPFARGEIVIFSDANSIYEDAALRKLVQNFNDPTVGYVSGKMIYANPEGTVVGDGCSTYMKYENFLRYHETKVGSVVGVDGGIDAIRKELYHHMSPDQLPDFVLPLKVVEKGYRVVYEPEAILRETALKYSQDEYKMRVRVALRAFWALWDMKHLLNFRENKLFAWQLWSHKVLRYLCFIFLIGAYLSNLALWPEGIIYKMFFILQNSVYGAAMVSTLFELKGSRVTFLYLFHYFALLNISSAQAFVKFLLRQKQVVWVPRKGV